MLNNNSKPEIEKNVYHERSIEVDRLNPTDLTKLTPGTHLTLKGLLIPRNKILEKRELKNQFLKELNLHIEPGKNPYEYRDIKTALIEIKLSSNEICDNLGMTQNELSTLINKTISKLDNIAADSRKTMYDEALELLSDEEGFKELERLKLEYDKATKASLLLSTAEEQKKLETNKLNLLSILKEGANGKKISK